MTYAQNLVVHLDDSKPWGKSELEKKGEDEETVLRVDLNGNDAFILQGLLKPWECTCLIEATEKLTYTFWNECDLHAKSYRNADTVEINDPKLADLLWKRLKHCIVESITISTDDARWEPGKNYVSLLIID